MMFALNLNTCLRLPYVQFKPMPARHQTSDTVAYRQLTTAQPTTVWQQQQPKHDTAAVQIEAQLSTETRSPT